jgi:hypothetical protein
MSPHLNRALEKRYPELFKEKSWPADQSAMALGCQCPDHWFQPLAELFGNLTQEMHQPITVPYEELTPHGEPQKTFSFLPPKIILTSVEEKYGSLKITYREDFEDIPETIWVKLNLKKFYSAMNSYYRKISEMITLATPQFGPAR